MVIIQFKPPSQPQIHYIECLAIDLGFDRKQRNAHMSEIVRREIKFIDDLSPAEASLVINQFKTWKYGEDL